MWKKIYELLEQIITLAQRVSRHDAQLEELRQEVRELTSMVHRLALEVNRLSDRQTSEREKMELWVENQLLRFERRLPPARRQRVPRATTSDAQRQRRQKAKVKNKRTGRVSIAAHAPGFCLRPSPFAFASPRPLELAGALGPAFDAAEDEEAERDHDDAHAEQDEQFGQDGRERRAP